MESIEAHIQKDRRILEDPMVSSQSRRHIEEELEQLERYAANHPGEDHDPTALELYCEDNPSALECKIHDN
jgi:hypothetical protein